MYWFPSGFEPDCLTSCVLASRLQVLQVLLRPAAVSRPWTDSPLQNARPHFPSHQLLFQIPCAFFPFHFGLYFPIL